MLNNHNVTNNGTDFIIKPAPLSITANNKSMILNGVLPTFGATYSGLSDGCFLNTAGEFVQVSNTSGFSQFPARYRLSSSFLRPTNAYAPRQVQIGLRLTF